MGGAGEEEVLGVVEADVRKEGRGGDRGHWDRGVDNCGGVEEVGGWAVVDQV